MSTNNFGGTCDTWKVGEERFFYEFLRIAGSRTAQECFEEISRILRTKSAAQVHNFYFNTLRFLEGKRKKTCCNLPVHKQRYLLVQFYENFVSKKRTDSFLKRNKQDISATESGSLERQDVKEPRKNEETRLSKEKVGIKPQSGTIEPKKKIYDIPSQLYAAPQLDILFVPFDDKLATCISSLGLDPCPRMALKHSKKVTDIVLELTELWATAVQEMGPGEIRLKAPDNSPVAFQAFSWGDPHRDAEISIVDLLIAVQVCTPASLGYTWESLPGELPQNYLVKQSEAKNVDISTPFTVDNLSSKDGHEIKKSTSGRKRTLTEIINEDSLILPKIPELDGKTDIDTNNNNTEQDSPAKQAAITTAEKDRIPMGLANLVYEPKAKKRKTKKKPKPRKTKKQNSPKKVPGTMKPEEILTNAAMHYAGLIREIQSYNMMTGKHAGSNLTNGAINGHAGAPIALNSGILQNGFDTHAVDKEEEIIVNLLTKEDSKLGISLAEALELCNDPSDMVEMQTKPARKNSAATPAKEKQADANLEQWASPPSSFQLPQEIASFMEHGKDIGSPKSLRGIFDSIQGVSPKAPAEDPRKSTEFILGNPMTDILNPSISLLSFLDGMSNSNWISKLEGDGKHEDSVDKPKALDSRPFGKLFDN
eukprot:jgi/Picsp_1/5514/NSC_02873-R1_---NA---